MRDDIENHAVVLIRTSFGLSLRASISDSEATWAWERDDDLLFADVTSLS